MLPGTSVPASAGSPSSVPVAVAAAGTKAAAPISSAPSVVAGSPAAAVSGALAGTSAVAAGSSAVASTAGTSAISGAAGGGAASSAAGTLAVAGSSGATGAAGNAGAAGTSAAGSSGASDFKSPCVSAGKEVLFIGDSYSDYPIAHQSLASFMEKLAIKDGALMQGDMYRNKAVAGTTLAGAIPSQWEDNKSMKPIKVVVMDGGGNDVLIDHQECRPEGSEAKANCKQVVQGSIDTIKKLFDSMKAEGVSDVLFFWYPHIPGGLLTGFEKGSSISDYTYPMLVDIAKAATTDKFRVYTVPTVDIFTGHDDYFYSDGLHANDKGEAKIAEAIWKVMKDNCIGQAASSGCCMP